MISLTYFAASSDLFSSLGINWPALLLNGAAFLVTVAILGKWVYPPLVRALDRKTDELNEAAKLKASADAELEAARTEAHQIVTDGHVAAREILAGAKAEAQSVVETARRQAELQAARVLEDGRSQLDREVIAAREGLGRETRELVASATAALIGATNTPAVDSELITRALERAK